MDNSRYKSIQSWQELQRFLKENPHYVLVDTGDRESRYRLISRNDSTGISVDGRSVRVANVTPHRLARDFRQWPEESQESWWKTTGVKVRNLATAIDDQF